MTRIPKVSIESSSVKTGFSIGWRVLQGYVSALWESALAVFREPDHITYLTNHPVITSDRALSEEARRLERNSRHIARRSLLVLVLHMPTAILYPVVMMALSVVLYACTSLLRVIGYPARAVGRYLKGLPGRFPIGMSPRMTEVVHTVLQEYADEHPENERVRDFLGEDDEDDGDDAAIVNEVLRSLNTRPPTTP